MEKKISQKLATRKRPRRIWSCLECRRKKLQCDHGQPACGRCTKAGAADSCHYSPTSRIAQGAPEDLGASGHSYQSARQASNDDLEARLKTLEKTVQLFHRSAAVSSESQLQELKQPDQFPDPREITHQAFSIGGHPFNGGPNRCCIRGASFRTKFNGKTCTESLVEQIPGLSSFTNDAFANFSAFEQAQQYLNRKETRTRLRTSGAAFDDEVGLRALLPSREQSDRLKQVYFDSFDFIFPVLHGPTFEQQYDQVWLNGNTEDGRAIILVLIVLAIAQCLTPEDCISGDGGTENGRDAATLILDSCDLWLRFRVQGCIDALDFQISFLFLLGRQVNARRSKRTWANAGNVLRIFQCSGLHRDPEEMSKSTSQLDKVLRRRLWAAAAEFELQAAFEHGMPALPWRGQSDVHAPNNTTDDTLETHAVAVYTKTSFLAVAGMSLRLRHQLNDELNDMDQAMTFTQALWYTNELQGFLKAVPRTWTGPSAEAAHALLTITLHQYILAIHEQQLHQSTSPAEQHVSKSALLESAVQIIDSHKAAMKSGSHLIELHCGDHLRAVLSMCIAYISMDPVIDRVLLSTFKKTVFDSMSQAISLHSDKLVYFGGGRVQLWLICAAEGVMRCTTNPDGRVTHIQRAVDQFWKPFKELIERANAVTDVRVSASQADAATGEPALPPQTEAAWPADVSGWTFDDFCFDFNDFLQAGPVMIE